MHGSRLHRLSNKPTNDEGAFVLYWMTSARRPHANHALDFSIAESKKRGIPLIIFEALRFDYPYASRRIHTFVLEGMRDNFDAFRSHGYRYVAFLERERDAGKGLLAAIAQRAALVVTDVFPGYFLARMQKRASEMLEVSLVAVDGNGVIPLADSPGVFATAHSFRRFLHRYVAERPFEFASPRLTHAETSSDDNDSIFMEISKRWRLLSREELADIPSLLEPLSIDPLGPGELVGGHRAGEARLKSFLDGQLHRYGDGHNHPDENAASGLSPYLHFGHIGSSAIVEILLALSSWERSGVSLAACGNREGFWNLPKSTEKFLDELLTWRELGFGFAYHAPLDLDRFEALPAWALKTLHAHRRDPRPVQYSLDELKHSATHDRVWNAAQTELRETGAMHNYLRMLWGKRILEWAKTPELALETLIELNNRYALDGRDPNSYTGIMWTLGRFDRAWGPERPIFGLVRYMSSENTLKKLHLKTYLQRFAPLTPGVKPTLPHSKNRRTQTNLFDVE